MGKRNKLTPEYFTKLLINSGRKRGHLRYYTLLVVVILLITAITSPRVQETLVDTQPGLYQVLTVNDGDTIVVDMNNVEQTIRLIGVDTPETQHPQKPVQCFGKAATNFTKDLVAGQTVRLEADPLSDNRDRYDRLLRYVFVGDTLVNKELIAEGYGFALTSFPHSRLDDFVASETTARQENRGLWSGCELIENEFGRFETDAAESVDGRY